MTDFPLGTILGYPRIGRRRELKRAVEAHWAGKIDESELRERAAELRRTARARLVELGLDEASAIPESFSFYDQVLDAALAVGALPERFAGHREQDGSIGLAAEFAAARGDGENAPLEMTKWFDTNYHYLVPEIGPDTVFAAQPARYADLVAEAAADGVATRPVVVGPVTLLALAKAADGAGAAFRPLDRLADLLPAYLEILSALRAAGAEWVQLDEPALVSETLEVSPAEVARAVAEAYAVLGASEHRPQLLVAAPYGAPSIAGWEALVGTPVEAIGLDLVRGGVPAVVDGVEEKTIVAGVVDARNIWRGDLDRAWALLEQTSGLKPARVAVGTSNSLQHVPHDVADEPDLDPRLKAWLAFADQKIGEVSVLARGLREGRPAVEAAFRDAAVALADRRSAPGVHDDRVRARTRALAPADFERGPVDQRVSAQRDALALPPLPTTTIGSFPQTGDIRRARAAHDRGELTTPAYEQVLRDEVERVIRLQEELGLDVLVHGEPERNDMVQYFAENLDGFAVTRNGWVQSYGSRATRPSILWGDVSRPAPITVRWATYAQSLTSKPVKGMLTGPVTILAWSFVRDDQPLGETARQVALALRDEIADLEQAGIGVIQVDEPALRELLPLCARARGAYLEWSVGSFRLATANARPATQIHTHLCYSEFGTVVEAIAALDADVTSIEAARSRDELFEALAGYERGIGPGVWDIHSPRVPSAAEIGGRIDRAVAAVGVDRVWVNPDCGLKTRQYDETVASLANLVAATGDAREALLARA
ncbi:5-methyltetrahydropteroyltriglutamate--homocysteine S-methyltransferase [Microbacterium oryzae]|uniref:5-methyltetrahydropteroyltriglutamate-- homocysteine S-methyltransferase n=1 Tax=Microbacterium oryzae TaxID=743009 RepID=UPI0025B1DE27|nr:5-methyltetrahydropteroyltriglutamate--homocysteine S-methyltransferase [Microbacterium oryzae]MDN3311816.1 5-methyltetrahydropteroyltriglutamate--homocysteine S-methyltransferase [Microbacterium oryzae]